jgi:hypothetical protein
MKKTIALLLSFIMVFALAACGKGGEEAESATAAPTTEAAEDIDVIYVDGADRRDGGGADVVYSSDDSGSDVVYGSAVGDSGSDVTYSQSGGEGGSGGQSGDRSGGSGSSQSGGGSSSDSGQSGDRSSGSGGGQGSSGSGGIKKTRKTDSLIEWMIEGKYSFDYEADIEGVKATGSIAVDGDQWYNRYDSLSQGTVQRVIKKGNTVYYIYDEIKTIMKYPANQADTGGFLQSGYSGITLVATGTGTISGKTLPYEEYRDGASSETMRFFFDNDKVYGFTSEVEGNVIAVIVTNAKNSVPKGIFDIPSAYDTYSE